MRVLRKVFQWLKDEIVNITPAVAFFLIAFNLIVLTDMLTTESYGLRIFSYIGASILAIIVGKAVLVANHMPVMNKFNGRPLIYGTILRGSTYFVFTVMIRFAEHLIRFISRYGSVDSAIRHMAVELYWPRFWAVQIWLAVILFVFAAYQELERAMGRGFVRRHFLGGRG